MSGFTKFFGRIMSVLWKDIIAFFKSIFDFIVGIFQKLISDFSYYKSVFDLYSQDFDALGWVLFVLSILLVVGAIALIIWGIFKISKRRYIAKRKVKDKIVLLREIDKLNNKVIDLMDQRSQLLALKTAELGYAPTKEDLKKIEAARKRAQEAIDNPEENKYVGFKFKTTKKGAPVFDKRGLPVIELEYKLGEDGKPLLDENKKPIPLIEFKKDNKGKILFDANGLPIPVDPVAAENQIEADKALEEQNAQEIGEDGEAIPSDLIAKARFPKLIRIDWDYRNYEFPGMTEEDMKMNLKELVDRFRNFAAGKLHLYYSFRTLALFFSGMGTTRFAILEGISGTGKTSLPYAFGKFFRNRSPIVAVQPSWKDRSELIGYLNEFTKKFNESVFLEELYKIAKQKDPHILVLDEMNLARIEYYFADFLSIMEMPSMDEWIIEIVNTDLEGDPVLLDHGKFLIPKNVWFLGTANNDDSTFSITDKVYDRAMSMSLNKKTEVFEPEWDADSMYMDNDFFVKLFDDAKAKYSISEEALSKLAAIDKYMVQNFKISFGNRIMKQFRLFVPCYIGCGGEEYDALDHLITRKILHKLEALNISFIKNELKGLIVEINKQFGKDAFNDAKEYINDLLKQV
jgi:hypothetical protein